MKRISLTVIALLILAACFKVTTIPTSYVKLEAQSFPTTVHCVNDPNAAADNIVQYKYQLNSNAPIILPASSCTATACSQVLTIPAPGNYSCSVIASNLKVNTDPTSLLDSPAAVVNFIISQAASKPANGTVKN